VDDGFARNLIRHQSDSRVESNDREIPFHHLLVCELLQQHRGVQKVKGAPSSLTELRPRATG